MKLYDLYQQLQDSRKEYKVLCEQQEKQRKAKWDEVDKLYKTIVEEQLNQKAYLPMEALKEFANPDEDTHFYSVDLIMLHADGRHIIENICGWDYQLITKDGKFNIYDQCFGDIAYKPQNEMYQMDVYGGKWLMQIVGFQNLYLNKSEPVEETTMEYLFKENITC